MGKQLRHLLPLAKSECQTVFPTLFLTPFPRSVLMLTKCFISSLERSAADFIPGSHRRGSHQNPVLSLQGAGRTSSGPTVSHFSGIQCQWDYATLMLPGHRGQSKVYFDLTQAFRNTPPKGATHRLCVFGDTVEDGGVLWCLLFLFPLVSWMGTLGQSPILHPPPSSPPHLVPSPLHIS